MHRISYSLKEKLQTFELLRKNNNNVTKTARDCGITSKMVRYWKKQENKICDVVNISTTFWKSSILSRARTTVYSLVNC